MHVYPSGAIICLLTHKADYGAGGGLAGSVLSYINTLC